MIMESGTIPVPREPSAHEKYLSKRLYADADAIEKALNEKELAGAVRQLALRGYDFADVGRGDEAYVRGVVDTLRKISVLCVCPPSQGIA